MGYLKIVLEDGLLKKFKEEAWKRFGYTRGALTIAGREAIKNWLSLKERDLNKSFKIVRNIVMKNLKKIEKEARDFRKRFRLR